MEKINQNKKAICILGGMGPEASAYLYSLLIELASKNFGAKNGNQFPEIIIYSIPVPDFISNTNNQKKAFSMLKERVRSVDPKMVSYFAIACNTAHILLEDLQKETPVPFVSIIEEVVNTVIKDNLQTIGILASPLTINLGLYQKKLGKNKIKCVFPDDNYTVALDRIIRNVIAGNKEKADSEQLALIADGMRQKGAEGIILGCTELPLVFPKKYNLPVYNSVLILALALLRKYYKQNTMRQGKS